MPTTILGKVTMIPRGTWVAGTYNKNEYVYYEPDNATYCSLKDGNTVMPSNDNVNWFMLCQGIGTASDNNYTNTDKDLVQSAVQPTLKNMANGYAGIGSDGLIDNSEFISVKNRIINVKDYGASGSSQTTTGTIETGSKTLTLTNPIDFKNGQGISIVGAGSGGSVLVTYIVSGAGTVNLVLHDNASSAVTNATVLHDDTLALQNALDFIANTPAKSPRTIFIPAGTYICTSVLKYSKNPAYSSLRIVGEGFTGSSGYGSTSGTLIQSRVQSNSGYKAGSIPALDLTASYNVMLENLRIEDSGNVPNSLTSIGILLGRTSDGWDAQQHFYKNISILLSSMDSSHNTSSISEIGHLGSVGIYNNGGEMFTLDNSIIMADLPLVFTSSNICQADYPSSSSTPDPGTMSGINVTKTVNLIAQGNTGMATDCTACAIFLDGVHDAILNAYIYNKSSNYGYMYQTYHDIWNIEINGAIESSVNNTASAIKCHGAGFSIINWRVLITVYGNVTYPVINLGTLDLRKSIISAGTVSSLSGQNLFDASNYLEGCIVFVAPAQVIGTAHLTNVTQL